MDEYISWFVNDWGPSSNQNFCWVFHNEEHFNGNGTGCGNEGYKNGNGWGSGIEASSSGDGLSSTIEQQKK